MDRVALAGDSHLTLGKPKLPMVDVHDHGATH
jgi:hypothetical protein